MPNPPRVSNSATSERDTFVQPTSSRIRRRRGAPNDRSASRLTPPRDRNDPNEVKRDEPVRGSTAVSGSGQASLPAVVISDGNERKQEPPQREQSARELLLGDRLNRREQQTALLH
jgi:hypothetical protein